MKKACGLFLIFALKSQLLLAQEQQPVDDATWTQCIIRYMGIAPPGGYPELCQPTILQSLDTFVPVCIEDTYGACLRAIQEAATSIVPACNKDLSYVRRSLTICQMQLLP